MSVRPWRILHSQGGGKSYFDARAAVQGKLTQHGWNLELFLSWISGMFFAHVLLNAFLHCSRRSFNDVNISSWIFDAEDLSIGYSKLSAFIFYIWLAASILLTVLVFYMWTVILLFYCPLLLIILLSYMMALPAIPLILLFSYIMSVLPHLESSYYRAGS